MVAVWKYHHNYRIQELSLCFLWVVWMPWSWLFCNVFDACFRDFQLICRFACLVCFQLPPASSTMLLRTSGRAQFDILSRFLGIVLLKSTSGSPWTLLATLHLDVGDKLFEYVWETVCTLLWSERTDSVELRALATCSTFCFLLRKSNLILSWRCFRTRSVDDGTAIPSGSSAVLRFQFLSFILVPTFFWLDCFNRVAAFLSRSASSFFLVSSSERGLFFAFSWRAFLGFILSATRFNGSSRCFLDRSVDESGFLGEVSVELSFLVFPISYSSWNTIKLETMNNEVPKNPFFIPCRTDAKRYGLLI